MEAGELEREQMSLAAYQEQDASSGWESDCVVAVSVVGQGEPAAKLNVVVDWCLCPPLVTRKLGLSRVIIISPQQGLRRTSLAAVLDALEGSSPA